MRPRKVAMERRPRRRSRGGTRSASRRVPTSLPPAAEPWGPQLWLFPRAADLRSALLPRTEVMRQMCCTRGRLVVLERGGAGVEVHQLPAGSDGARKPSEWGRALPARPSRHGLGCEGGRLGPALARTLFSRGAGIVGA